MPTFPSPRFLSRRHQPFAAACHHSTEVTIEETSFTQETEGRGEANDWKHRKFPQKHRSYNFPQFSLGPDVKEPAWENPLADPW